ncbi:hypothetical protein [Microcoleus sp.]|uniref:hypothetical protein n=1 Tax=Microcoleus sp. TaxID=44472 RepID=UPI0035231B88
MLAKLKSAIQNYLDADTESSKGRVKRVITELISAASATDAILIPEILQEFEELPNWLKLRFQKGSLYEEGNEVFGWHENSQVQAVSLPVRLDIFSYDDGEDLVVVKYLNVTHEEMGFAPAIDLPFVDLPFGGIRVVVPVSEYNFDDTFLTMCGYGWASPCSLQWSYFERSDRSDLEGYVVERSIISHGFWKAWDWWPDCWRWYYDKYPDLFEDAEWWGPPVRHESPDNSCRDQDSIIFS